MERKSPLWNKGNHVFPGRKAFLFAQPSLPTFVRSWGKYTGTSFLFVCGEALTQPLTVIRTRWLLILTNNQAKSSENGRVSRCNAESEYDRLGFWGPEQPYLWACIATEVLLPMNLPLFPFCVTSFQHLHCGGICSPKGSWELGFVS